MPRFALLEHRREGHPVHWDLLLDVGTALRTWAIDAPIVPGLNLPARALKDHRRLYLDYEGEVSGGRGRVHRVDRGVYEPRIWTPERVCVAVWGDQLAGVVELRRADGDPAEAEPERAWNFRLGNFD